MKKYLVILTLLLLSSCYKKGEVRQHPENFIEIHGKVYKLMSIVPCTGCYPIWIMYPEDSSESVPVSLNWTQTNGKYTRNASLIKVH